MGTRPPISMTTPVPATPSPLPPTVNRPTVVDPTLVPRAAPPAGLPTTDATARSGLVSPAPTQVPAVIATKASINFSSRSDIVPKVLQPFVATKAAQSELVIVSEPLNVPSIKWEVHVDPVLLKAHTSFSLDEKEPEIFEVVNQLLTPYLQRLMGEPLLAYKLQVAYGESYPEKNNPETIVTHFEVKIILEYLSDSIESYRKPVQEVASDHLHRFFEGSERYQLLGDLRRGGIDVSEIVLEDEDFRSPVFDGVTITQVQGPGSSNNNNSSSNNKNDKTGTFAAIGAGAFVLVAIMYVGYRSKRSRLGIAELRLGNSSSDSESTSSNRSDSDKLSNGPEATRQIFPGGFGRFLKKGDDEKEVSSRSDSAELQVVTDAPEAKRQRFSGGFGHLFRKGNDHNEVSNSNNSSRSSSAELQIFSDEPEDTRQRFSGSFRNFFRRGIGKPEDSDELKTSNDEPEDSDEPKTRQRSYSGSFRRFPAGGIAPAAIQKEPAFSKDILKLSSVSSRLAHPPMEDESEVPSSMDPPKCFDDQSYSVAGDYNIPTEYDIKASPLPSVYGGGRHSNNVSPPKPQDDEFSMPDQYSVAPSMMNDEFSMPSQSVRGLKRPPISKPVSPEHSIGRSFPKSETIDSPWSLQSAPSSDYPLLLMDGEGAVESPLSDVLMDEWSVDSYITQQSTRTPRPPAKAGWTKPKKGSARKQQKERQDASDLNIPALA